MKTRNSIAALVAVLSLVAAVCGDTEGGTTTEGPPPDTAPPATEVVTTTAPPTTTVPPDAGTEVLEFIPPVPRNADGESIEELWPDPELCDPEGPEYVALAELPFEEADGDPFLDELVAATAVFENRLGEPFEVTVAAADRAEIEEFLAAAAICLETQEAPADLEFLPQVAVADLILLGVLGDFLGDLAAARDGLGEDATLRDAIGRVFDDVAEVEAALVAALADELAAATESGLLTEDEAAAVDLAGSVGLVLDEPGAPLLIDPALDADTEEELYDALFSDDPDEVGNVLVTVDTLSDPGEGIVISGAIDPFVGRYSVRGYRAKCAKSVRAAVSVSDGKVRLRLFGRSPWRWYGSRSAASWSGWIYGSSSSYRTFDTSVEGLLNSNTYAMHGGWYLGTGGGC